MPFSTWAASGPVPARFWLLSVDGGVLLFANGLIVAGIALWSAGLAISRAQESPGGP